MQNGMRYRLYFIGCLSVFMGCQERLILADASLDKALSDCGVGGYVFEGKGYASVSNFITSSSTDYGVSSSASSSSNTSCRGGSASLRAFMDESYAYLEEDISQGGGNHLKALAMLMGCPEASHAQLFSDLQHTYPEYLLRIEKTGLADQAMKTALLLDTVHTSINHSAELRTHCGLANNS